MVTSILLYFFHSPPYSTPKFYKLFRGTRAVGLYLSGAMTFNTDPHVVVTPKLFSLLTS